MEEVSIVGVDLAKQVFQVHGATSDGRVLFRKKLSRSQFPRFMAGLRPCVVAMEACGTAHYWGREFASMGHDVRLIPPVYVKAFVKRQKNDGADAEAVAEAAMRPTMRTVAVKTSEQQARAMLFRTRDLLVGQRTQMVNALRGHLAEHGIIVGKGLGNAERLATLIASDDLPELVRTMGRLYLSQITQLHEEIDQIDRRIAAEAKQSDIGPAATISQPSHITMQGMTHSACGLTTRRKWWLEMPPPRQHETKDKQLGNASPKPGSNRSTFATAAPGWR
ncbi:IS110 family transposase [Rhizobium sp. SYY.PMSO]|uniref:IS110 family transposase n=1 Tax=Rhizobium sp. SYY.PMSO TaxID=3382192 RepID=UPI0039902374